MGATAGWPSGVNLTTIALAKGQQDRSGVNLTTIALAKGQHDRSLG